MKIELGPFYGEMPKITPRLLPNNVAQRAQNALIDRATLRPQRGNTSVETLTKPGVIQSLYRWADQYWFHWTADVDVVEGAIENDASERVYFTGDGVPKMTYSPIAVQGGTAYPTNSYDLGVPAPDAAPTAAISAPTGAITDVSQGNPVNIESAGHGLLSGTEVTISDVVGPTEINDQTFFITVVDADNFTLDDEDGSGYDAYVSGGTWTVAEPADPARVESTQYVVTYVTALQEEGPPSDPTAVLDVGYGKVVDLSNLPTGPAAGSYNITTKRIYRASSGASSDAYQLVVELPIAQTSYTDDMQTLGPVLATEGWEPPPADLHSLTAFGNGGMVGLSGKDLLACEPNQPHAWPYRYTMNDQAVGLGVFGGTIVAITQKDAYLFVGSSSEYLSQAPTKIQQGCVSKRGIVSIGNYGVIYPSPDGLVLIGVDGTKVISENWFNAEDWQTRIGPESIHAYLWENKYLAFYDNGSDQGAFIFDPRKGDAGLLFVDFYADGAFRDPLRDAFYFTVGNDLYLFDDDAAAPLTYIWRSKKFDVRDDVNFSVGEVSAETYDDLVLRIYGDGVLRHTQTVTSKEPFRMPGGYMASVWEIELEGTDQVHYVRIAEDVEDIG